MHYYNSEDQHGGHFHTVICDVRTYIWWDCDKERASVVVPKVAYPK